MISSLMLPGNAPFVAAIGLMIVIGALECVSMLMGLSLTEHAGSLLVLHFGLDHADSGADASVVGQFLGWLHVGRVPLLILLILFLLGFSVVGLALQTSLQAVAGFMMPTALAVGLAAAAALPFVRHTGKFVARFLPQSETTAVSEADFIGRTARIITGEASLGNPAEARLVDEHGQQHYVRVEPDEAGRTFAKGTTVLLVSRISGSRYHAIENPRPELL
ncbi:OB-fold-containig protein [Burkholderia sp. MSMB1826]|uniref:OB-fold-containig protein n=1 Tax=Burkholderia sp. MSMB1826 TaxID=1637875 RepID=UPI0007C740F5|nr:OB-fold-containig protein [Burkholderia sp. MSMB1826]